ncbi:alpha/beta fold hydrolase [Saccharopolyspora sp. NPDC050389]|uniref:RBBP9/YdeN family alpha/beta hydrolase n=1 Tax=Saccharopolyspora sp. NPDC050389 TaxID=3155516 RepID=UPI0033CA714A
MNNPENPTIVIVPGLRDHVADHWQTHLADKLPNTRTVPPLEHDKLGRDARVSALDRVVSDIDGPIVLVAHSAGVMITVHWAQLHTRVIQGALLATPPDFESRLPDGYPAPDELYRNGWLPTPRELLPFPSIVAASTNDPLARLAQVAEMARDWGSRLVDLGAVGHLNPAAGYGPWPRAEEFIRELARTGEDASH